MPAPVNRSPATAVDGWLARMGRSLWAPRCLVCGELANGRRDLCQPCAAALPWNRLACPRCAAPGPPAAPCAACLRQPPPLDTAHAAFVYAFPLDRLLPRFKFHRDLAAGRLLSAAMAGAFASLPRPDALLPIPLHRARLRERGYDQALELARPLGRALALPLCDGLLLRARATTPQSRLHADDRRRNLRGAFAAQPSGGALPRHVALVDDVMTTGATLHAAAIALRRAGVARVDAWVAARVP
ncbi:ComF family protein [Luteimonas sp. MC1782]|uniref:ComF family protein n=1 Tax=Luteimonas sp. MC1782 TaxID=2760305 RepID=UPI001603188E|nr:ComF family protein [Luteimonas sp. MC1782]MBB1473313.1 ComF family protein [Luteimonas sp. MC1782]